MNDAGSRGSDGPSVTQQAELDEQSLLGNEMLAARLHGGPPDDDPSGARDAAVAMLDRAALALELERLDPAALARWRAILEASALDHDVRDGIRGRLDADAAAAQQVHDAMRDCFGADHPEARDRLAADLDRAARVLDGARRVDDGWSVGATRVDAALGAEALVLAAHADQPPERAAAILAFCRAVDLALPEDDDEETDLGPDLAG